MTLAIDIRKIIDSDHAHLIHPLFHPTDQTEPYIWVQGNGAMIRAGRRP